MAIAVKSFPKKKKTSYQGIRPKLKTGDLLLCSGSRWTSRLIQRATGSCWSHVGFVYSLADIDRVMVLESVESSGVRAVALSKYLSNYNNDDKPYPGGVAIARHAEFDSKASAAGLGTFSRAAVDRFGYPYDRDEIAKITARIVGSLLFKSKKDRKDLEQDREYICSEYVWECYSKLGIDVASKSGSYITPADFARDPRVSLVAVLQKN